MKIHPVGAQMFHVDGRTDRHDEVFRIFMIASKNPYWHPTVYFVRPNFARAVLASGFPTTPYSHALTFTPARATRPTHLILVIFVEILNREAPIMSYCLSSYYYCCFRSSIPLNTLSSNTLTVASGLLFSYLPTITLYAPLFISHMLYACTGVLISP